MNMQAIKDWLDAYLIACEQERDIISPRPEVATFIYAAPSAIAALIARVEELEAEKRTLKATIQTQMLNSLDKSNEGKNEDHWQAHASALVYVLTLMRQIEEPTKRHTTGYQLPLVEK